MANGDLDRGTPSDISAGARLIPERSERGGVGAAGAPDSRGIAEWDAALLSLDVRVHRSSRAYQKGKEDVAQRSACAPSIWIGNTGLWSWYVKLTADHLCGAALAGGRDGKYVVVVRRDGVGG